MTKIVEIRCQKLMSAFLRFQAEVLISYPELRSNVSFHFTLTLTKDKQLKLQYLGAKKTVDIIGCRSTASLHKKLGYLSSLRKLAYAEDAENQNQFSVKIKNSVKNRFKPKSEKGQLELTF